MGRSKSLQSSTPLPRTSVAAREISVEMSCDTSYSWKRLPLALAAGLEGGPPAWGDAAGVAAGEGDGDGDGDGDGEAVGAG